MPAIVNPSHTGMGRGRGMGKSAAASRSAAMRIRIALRRESLTHELAAGVDPASSPELELLAKRLTSDRSRRQLVRSLRRTIAEARRPSLSRGGPVIIQRAAVLDAEDAFGSMVERLRRPQPVRVQGIAIAYEILGNAAVSALYQRSEPGTLREQMLIATSALDSGGGSSHDFALAA